MFKCHYTVYHLFAYYPYKYQKYNIKLIERLNNSGVYSVPINYSVKQTKLKGVINIKKSNKYILDKIVTLIKNYKSFISFKKNNDISFFKAFNKFYIFSQLIFDTPSVLHIHHSQIIDEMLLFFLKMNNIKFIISYRGDDALLRPYCSKNEESLFTRIIEEADIIHCVSNNISEKISARIKNKDKVITNRRTVEVEKTIIQQDLSKNKRKINICTITRFSWEKGIIDALKAISILHKKEIPLNYIICGDFNNAYYTEVNFWVRKLSLDDVVVFKGFLSSKELNLTLSNTDIYLQTSLSEGIPNTILRAVFNRVPTVTTNAGGISEVFKNGYDGLLVDVGNVKAISNSLEKLIIDYDLRVKIRNSECKLNSDYNEEINTFKKMYESLI